MGNSKLIEPFILSHEGGLSRSKGDTASRAPAPWTYKGYNDWHTNKGITFTTFQTNAPKYGYAVTADNFFLMPYNLWEAIFKGSYWDYFNLDKMDSEAIAGFIANADWGSGNGGAFSLLSRYLGAKGIHVSTKNDIVPAFNKLAAGNEEIIFLELIAFREEYLKNLNQPQNLDGWLHRSADLKAWGLLQIKKKSS